MAFVCPAVCNQSVTALALAQPLALALRHWLTGHDDSNGLGLLVPGDAARIRATASGLGFGLGMRQVLGVPHCTCRSHADLNFGGKRFVSDDGEMK